MVPPITSKPCPPSVHHTQIICCLMHLCMLHSPEACNMSRPGPTLRLPPLFVSQCSPAGPSLHPRVFLRSAPTRAPPLIFLLPSLPSLPRCALLSHNSPSQPLLLSSHPPTPPLSPPFLRPHPRQQGLAAQGADKGDIRARPQEASQRPEEDRLLPPVLPTGENGHTVPLR